VFNKLRDKKYLRFSFDSLSYVDIYLFIYLDIWLGNFTMIHNTVYEICMVFIILYFARFVYLLCLGLLPHPNVILANFGSMEYIHVRTGLLINP